MTLINIYSCIYIKRAKGSTLSNPKGSALSNPKGSTLSNPYISRRWGAKPPPYKI